MRLRLSLFVSSTVACAASTIYLAAAFAAPPPQPPPPPPMPPAPPSAQAPAAAPKAALAGVTRGARPACPTGASWHDVPDRAPVRRCTTPVQGGCMLPDGRRHGAWVRYDLGHGCRFPKEQLTYQKGRKTGPAVEFAVVCSRAKRHRQPTCRARVARRGAYLDGKRHGVWTELDAAGRKTAQARYDRGVKHGPFAFFNSSGVLIGRGCNREGAELWRADFLHKEVWKTPCPVARAAAKPVSTSGVAEVSAAQKKASKLVRLAQATKRLPLRLRYLRKAVELAPKNQRYRRLLADVEAALAPQTPPVKKTP